MRISPMGLAGVFCLCVCDEINIGIRLLTVLVASNKIPRNLFVYVYVWLNALKYDVLMLFFAFHSCCGALLQFSLFKLYFFSLCSCVCCVLTHLILFFGFSTFTFPLKLYDFLYFFVLVNLTNFIILIVLLVKCFVFLFFLMLLF